MNKTINYEWVIGQFEGDRAKSVKAHADAGTGYFVIDSFGRGNMYTVIVAFRRPVDSPRPEHLELLIDEKKIKKYEDIIISRMGISKKQLK